MFLLSQINKLLCAGVKDYAIITQAFTIRGNKQVNQTMRYATSLFFLFVSLLSFAGHAQQSISQRLSQQLTESAATQLNADLHLGELTVNGLTDELSARQVRLATRVAQLSEPLNQLIIADQIELAGDWLSLGQQRVAIKQLSLSGAQLTLAYYGTGQSNLHQLLDKLQQLQKPRYQPAQASDEAVSWQLEQLQFTDVTINLFDRGEPIASVHVPELIIEELDRSNSTDAEIKALIFPIIEQLLRQWRQGSDTIQVNGPALTRFLMREALAF